MANNILILVTKIRHLFRLPYGKFDTDQIIPARFLKATTRDGFGKNLFRDWRYENNDETKPKADFVLNDPHYKGKILVQEKILVVDHRENMLHGPLWIMDSMWLYQQFLCRYF